MRLGLGLGLTISNISASFNLVSGTYQINDSGDALLINGLGDKLIIVSRE